MPPVLLQREARLQNSGTFVYAANTRQDLEFGVPGRMIKRLYLDVAFTATVSSVTVPGTVHKDGPVNLIQKIEMTLDGKAYKVGTGAAFFRLGQTYDRTDGVNTGLFSGAAGVYTCRSLIPIFCELAGGHTKTDTILDGRRFQKIQLHVTWGDGTSLFVGNTSTVAITAATADLYIDDVAPFALANGHLMKQSEAPFAVAATSGALYMPIPYERGSVLRAIQFRTVDGSDISDAVLNKLTLKLNGGQSVPLNTLGAKFLEGKAKHDAGLFHPAPDGYYHLEFPDNGRALTTGLGAGVPENVITGVEFYADETLGSGTTSIVGHVISTVPVATF